MCVCMYVCIFWNLFHYSRPTFQVEKNEVGVCQRLVYFHLGRISDLLSIHCSSSHTLLAAEKRFRVA